MKKMHFCKKNKFATKTLYAFFKQTFKHVKIKRKDCVGKCKTCKHCPFVLLDGEVVKATTTDELYDRIAYEITKQWWVFRKK